MHPVKTIDQRQTPVSQFATRHPLVLHSCAYVLLVLLHLTLATRMRYPTVFYDEGTYLGYARYLAGTQHSLNMAGGAAGAHYGYPLLLVPAFLLSSTFYSQYHLVLAINGL